MEKPVSLSWHEYLPSGTALAAFIHALARGDRGLSALLLPALLAVIQPVGVALGHRLPQHGWARFCRFFLPLVLLFPLYHVIVRLQPAASAEVETALYFSFAQAAVIAYLYALLAYAYIRNFKGFRRLSLGIQGTFCLSVLPPLIIPSIPAAGSGPLLVTIMTFLLFHDFLYRQPSLIASFFILAVLKVVAAITLPFALVAEGAALLIPALVLAGLKLSGYPR